MKRIPVCNLHEGGRGFENNSHKQGLVVNFEHVKLPCIKPTNYPDAK